MGAAAQTAYERISGFASQVNDMSAPSQLAKLEASKSLRGHDGIAGVEKLLASLKKYQCSNAERLVRFHDTLLFLRAFPHSRKVVELTEQLLAGIPLQVTKLVESGADLNLLDSEQFSGIAGATLTYTFTYDVALWLTNRYGTTVNAEWNVDEQGSQLGVSLPRFIPLFADDSQVEADTPYLDWMGTAAGSSQTILPWLLRRIEATPMNPLEKTAWYDALRVNISWSLGNSSASRTFARHSPAAMYFHREPLIQRSQVSLQHELKSRPLPVHKLSPAQGEQLLDIVRAAVTVRYRELYGTTRGDPTSVIEANVGRGVHIFVWGLPPQRRLPLRAYYAGMTFKNGVPINYIEGIGLFEWMEVGFNTFYAFREGETAWIYAKVLHLLYQLGGLTCFSIYPYQIGDQNEEAIKSGAFWFYRKLGFQPGRPELLALTQREEKKLARNTGYRTSPQSLRKLAAGHMFYEFAEGPYGLWNEFSVRNIGLAVQRRMAEAFGGDLEKMRLRAVTDLERILDVSTESWGSVERSAFESFAYLLSLVAELQSWTKDAKDALIRIIRAKATMDESDYLRLLQKHHLLKLAVACLGSSSAIAEKNISVARTTVSGGTADNPTRCRLETLEQVTTLRASSGHK